MELFDKLRSLVSQKLREVDIDTQPASGLKLIEKTKQQLVDSRLDLRDYDYSESLQAQLKSRQKALTGMIELRQSLLLLSSNDILGSADIAQLDAQLSQVIERLN